MVVLAAAAPLISACATTSANLFDDGTIIVEIVNTDRSGFDSVSAHQDGGDLVVSGYIKRSHGTIQSHVDVEIIDKNGNVMQRSESMLRRSSTPSRGKHRYRFNARFSVAPSAVTTVRVQLDSDGHD